MSDPSPHKLRPTKQRPRIDAVAGALYVTSGNVCGYSDPETHIACETALYEPGFAAVQAEIAHIVGLNEGSARYEQGPPEAKNTYDNLILLCPNCHNRVDKLEVARHSKAVMLAMKERHTARSGDRTLPFSISQIEAIVSLVADQMVLQGITEVAPLTASGQVSLAGSASMYVQGAAESVLPAVASNAEGDVEEVLTTEGGESITTEDGEPITVRVPRTKTD